MNRAEAAWAREHAWTPGVLGVWRAKQPTSPAADADTHHTGSTVVGARRARTPHDSK